MRMILTPDMLLRQPQYPAQIDFANPICAGCLGAFLPSGTRPAIGGVTNVPGGQGVGFRGISQTQYYQASPGKIVSGLPSWTVMAVIQTTQATTASGRSIYCERAATGNDILKIDSLNATFGATAILTLRDDAGTLVQFAGTTVINDGKPHVIAMVQYGSADHRLFVDGRQDGSSITAITNTYTNAIESRIGADAGDSTSFFNDPVYTVIPWSRGLLPAEIASLSANPWQVYKAQPRRIRRA